MKHRFGAMCGFTRQVLSCLLWSGIVVAVSLQAARVVAGDGEFLVGGDISALAKIEKHGGVYRDRGVAGDAIQIMRKSGANCFRLRLFVNPTGRGMVVNDLPYTVALAKRIRAAGAALLLDFHYSDTWADPAHQSKPAAWKNLPFAELEQRVYSHTRESLASLYAAGAAPDLVQIGNEVTPGMLWPDGKLYGAGDQERQWQQFAKLLKAGVRGVQDAAAGKDVPRIVLHIDKGASWAATKYFFDRIEKHQVPYDVIGLSYYPWWHGKMQDAQETVNKAAQTFGKQVLVVEAGYPYRPLHMGNQYHAEHMQYPQTPEGQKAFLQELIQIVHAVPEGRGIGVIWWYPESILVKGLRIWHGGSTALFDNAGEPTPALSVFAAAARPKVP